jgi:hypothetical protein
MRAGLRDVGKREELLCLWGPSLQTSSYLSCPMIAAQPWLMCFTYPSYFILAFVFLSGKAHQSRPE